LLIYNITHFDLDGVGSSILMYQSLKKKKFWGHSYEHQSCGYNFFQDDDKFYNKFISKGDLHLIITDLNIPLDILENLLKISTIKTILLIDHHQTYDFDKLDVLKEEFKHKFICVVDDTYCATKLTYNYLKEKQMISEEYEFFANIVDTYDRWQIEDPLFKSYSFKLNDLFFKYGYTDFFGKFKKPFKEFDSSDKAVLSKINEERMKYLKTTKNNYLTNIEDKVVLITNPEGKYINEITLAFPNYALYLILKGVKEKKVSFSVRIKDDRLSFLNIREKLLSVWDKPIELGGHDKAGGLLIELDDMENFLEVFFEIVLEKI
jgi:oligoribonuclease NrnB/cAMP/cGMP phosphodiesterase (DHH superfamily)